MDELERQISQRLGHAQRLFLVLEGFYSTRQISVFDAKLMENTDTEVFDVKLSRTIYYI